MTTTFNVRDEIQQELAILTDTQLHALLTLLREIKKPMLIGEPGWQMIERVKSLDFTEQDLDEMQRAIDDFSEHGWAYPDVNFDE